jgi:benzodiazapine receptor
MDLSGLNRRNYLNVAAYLGNVLTSYLIGARGVGNAETNEYLSLKYQTLVTPASFAFAIWGIIFFAQAAFTVAQLLPNKRNSPLVQDGIKDYYIGACVCQILWTFFFGNEYIALSFFAMLGILACLFLLFQESNKIDSEGEKADQYLLFRFPFIIHLGWIVVASFVNLNVLLVSLNAQRGVLASVAILTVFILLAIAGYATWWLKADITISLVIAWALFGVAVELKDPKQSIVAQFRDSTINSLVFVAGFTCLLVCILVTARAVKTYVKVKALANLCGGTEDVITVEEDIKDPSSDYVKV